MVHRSLEEIPRGFCFHPRDRPRDGIKLDALDDESLRELRDLDHEKQLAVQQARLQPWRR